MDNPRSNLIAAAVGAVLGILLTVAIGYGRVRSLESQSSVAEGRATAALISAEGHEAAAAVLRGQLAETETREAQFKADAERWRKVAGGFKIPDPPPIPETSPQAVARLRSVGLASTTEDPLGVALALGDAGTVHTWGLTIPVLENKQIALQGLIAGLDGQVGTLTQGKGILVAENLELRAGNKDLRIASDQFKVAYEKTDKALTWERRIGKVKVGGAIVVTYFVTKALIK
jgi:hypothetical protein